MTTVTPLPSPPLITDSQSVFNTKAFNFVAAQGGFGTEINAVAGEVNTAAAAAALAKTAAETAATGAIGSAQAAAQSAGATQWVSGATYAVGVCVWSPLTFYTYRRRIAGTGTTDPSQDATNWALAAMCGLVPTISNTATVALSVNQFDIARYTSGVVTWTLPPSPAPRDRVGVKSANGRADNVIDLAGQPFEGTPGAVTIDLVGASMHLIYIDAAYGWGIE
jgi:hypothetical protein